MPSGFEIVPSNPVKKHLKKLKDKRLKQLFLETIYDEIALDPYSGTQKTGDLSDIWVKELHYQKADYRLAYTISDDESQKIVLLLLSGTHEGFYDELKHYLK